MRVRKFWRQPTGVELAQRRGAAAIVDEGVWAETDDIGKSLLLGPTKELGAPWPVTRPACMAQVGGSEPRRAQARQGWPSLVSFVQRRLVVGFID